MNKKRDEKQLSRASVAFAAATLASIASTHAGCALASANRAAGPKAETDAPARKTAVQLSSASGATNDPLGTLEEGLSKVHSDRVTVSTALLKSLVRNQRIQQTQCKNISGQLEALKNIDLEETGETKE